MRFTTLALLCAPPLLAQYDDQAPEPIERVRGGVVVYGAERGEYRADFLRRIEDAPLVLLCAPGVDAAAVVTAWEREDRPPPRPVATSREDADDPSLERTVAQARAIFLVGDAGRLGQAYAGTAVGRGLRDALLHGALVGARGQTAQALVALPLAPREGPAAAGFDLLQGAFLEPALPASGEPSERLARAMEALPMFVGLGVGPQGLLVLDQRWLTGEDARAWVAAGAGRPQRVVSLAGRRARADLGSLSRSAQARALRPWPPAAPAPPRVETGALMLGGGPMPRGTYERFLELAGGPEAPIVYVPCEYAETIDRTPGFVRTLQGIGAGDVRWIHTKDRKAADGDAELLAQLDDARGVWFGGGRQWNLVDSYQHTEVHRLVHAVLERGGVVGGSSAGASIQADYMARGNPLGNVAIMSEGYEEGLGLLTGVAVDQHFSQRGRLPDLTSLVTTYPQYLGIGIDEGAVLVVRGSMGEVMGSAVHFLDGRGEQGLVHQRVEGGQRFDLARRVLVE